MAVGTQSPSGQPSPVGEIRQIGDVAAENIARVLKIEEPRAVAVIQRAIADEINAMSAHFTLAVSDVQTHYEAAELKLKQAYERDVADIKSAFRYVESNVWRVVAAFAAAFALGVLVGLAV